MGMGRPATIIWTPEHEAKLNEHGVSVEEANEIIRNNFDRREPSHSNPHTEIVDGYTAAGRYLMIAFIDDAEFDVVLGITGYEPTNEIRKRP